MRCGCAATSSPPSPSSGAAFLLEVANLRTSSVRVGSAALSSRASWSPSAPSHQRSRSLPTRSAKVEVLPPRSFDQRLRKAYLSSTKEPASTPGLVSSLLAVRWLVLGLKGLTASWIAFWCNEVSPSKVLSAHASSHTSFSSSAYERNLSLSRSSSPVVLARKRATPGCTKPQTTVR